MFNIPIIKSNSCFPGAHCQSTLGPWDGRQYDKDDDEDDNHLGDDDDHLDNDDGRQYDKDDEGEGRLDDDDGILLYVYRFLLLLTFDIWTFIPQAFKAISSSSGGSQMNDGKFINHIKTQTKTKVRVS